VSFATRIAHHRLPGKYRGLRRARKDRLLRLRVAIRSSSRTFPRSVIADQSPPPIAAPRRSSKLASAPDARNLPLRLHCARGFRTCRLSLRAEIQRQLVRRELRAHRRRIEPLHLPALQPFRMLHAIPAPRFAARNVN